jgi:hypothetical protein
MPNKDIIIRIDNKHIYFNHTLSIPVRNSNLPMDYMTFRFSDVIFWKIELIHYSDVTKCWHAKVIDYTVKNIETFNKQKSTRPIERVEFDKLDWQQLEPQLSSYKAIKLVDNLYNHNINTVQKTETIYQQTEAPFNKTSYKIPEEVPNTRYGQEIESFNIPKRPYTEHLNINFSVKFQAATFINGSVTFKKYIKNIGTEIDFSIENSCLLEEFDNIKLWFSKKLKTKRFNVRSIITLVDRKFSHATTSSPEIEMITPNIIESIKYDRTIALTKPPKTDNPEKSIFNTDDLFQLIDSENRDGNVFNQSGPEIIKSLTQTEFVRNRKQLEYLSDVKQTVNSKIHYTLNPLFGFIFLNETKLKYHFVWELLQSHATYVWSIDIENKDINSLYAKIEEIINIIKIIGRDGYKKTYSTKNIGYEFTFKTIDHHDITINSDDGFKKWKRKLDELLA